MLSVDREAVICDMAETYGIYDLYAVPTGTLAILAAGLRDDSRIKMKLSGMKVKPDILLLAAAVDRLSFILWTKTEDAKTGANRPPSIVESLTGYQKKENGMTVFDSMEEFEAARDRILRGDANGN